MLCSDGFMSRGFVTEEAAILWYAGKEIMGKPQSLTCACTAKAPVVCDVPFQASTYSGPSVT